MTIVSFAVLGLAVGACGQQTNNEQQAGGTPSKGPASTAPSTVPMPTAPSGGASGGPVKPDQDVTVEGVIEKGVEPGCYVLTPTGDGPKYLVLVKQEPPLGVPVTVKGRTTNVMSYCQQGTPLEVSQVERK